MSYYGRLWQKRATLRESIETFKVMAPSAKEARASVAALTQKIDEMEAVEKEMDSCDDSTGEPLARATTKDAPT